MTQTEGVLKTVELSDNNTLYLEFQPYHGTIEKLAIDAQAFLTKLLKNEKITMLIWEHDNSAEDVVSIRGVAKDIPILARY